MSHTLSISIPDHLWEANESLTDPQNTLHATLVINGLSTHLEAWEVADDEEGVRRAVAHEYEDDFALLRDAVHADGRFDTTTIRGRRYIIIATPFC